MPDTPTLTASELAEIAARAEAATKGPWSPRIGDRYPDDVWVASDAERPWEQHQTMKFVWLRGMGGGDLDKAARDGRAQAIQNAAFIAHSREDVPRLLAHISALQAELDRRTFALGIDAEAVLTDLRAWPAAEHSDALSSAYVSRLMNQAADVIETRRPPEQPK